MTGMAAAVLLDEKRWKISVMEAAVILGGCVLQRPGSG